MTPAGGAASQSPPKAPLRSHGSPSQKRRRSFGISFFRHRPLQRPAKGVPPGRKQLGNLGDIPLDIALFLQILQFLVSVNKQGALPSIMIATRKYHTWVSAGTWQERPACDPETVGTRGRAFRVRRTRSLLSATRARGAAESTHRSEVELVFDRRRAGASSHHKIEFGMEWHLPRKICACQGYCVAHGWIAAQFSKG
jgi:hypothetical protein